MGSALVGWPAYPRHVYLKAFSSLGAIVFVQFKSKHLIKSARGIELDAFRGNSIAPHYRPISTLLLSSVTTGPDAVNFIVSAKDASPAEYAPRR